MTFIQTFIRTRIKIYLIKAFTLISLILLTALPRQSHAHDNIYSGYDKLSSRIFTSYESNGADYIQGIGMGFTHKDSKTNLGFQLNTSLNYAEVVATDGYVEDFFAWQGSVKLGLFSKVSVYVEAGVDLTELFFDDLRYHDDDYYDDYYDDYHDYHDDIDAFVGFGAGVRAGSFNIEVFSRLREIDSRYWEAESEFFNGVQFSINF